GALLACGEETPLVPRVGNPADPLEHVEHTREMRQASHDAVAERGDDSVAFGDEAADLHGATRHLCHMWLAFGLVRIEQRVRRVAAEDGGQLPAQIGGVAYACRHALADPRRHGMCGIPGKEYAADPPPLGDADMMAVDHRAEDLHMFVGDA